MSRLPFLDPRIVEFLKEKLPPIEYTMGINKEEFVEQAVFRAGQREVLCRLEKIVTEQEK